MSVNVPASGQGANILADKDANVKLADFGVAKQLDFTHDSIRDGKMVHPCGCVAASSSVLPPRRSTQLWEHRTGWHQSLSKWFVLVECRLLPIFPSTHTVCTSAATLSCRVVGSMRHVEPGLHDHRAHDWRPSVSILPPGPPVYAIPTRLAPLCCVDESKGVAGIRISMPSPPCTASCTTTSHRWGPLPRKGHTLNAMPAGTASRHQ